MKTNKNTFSEFSNSSKDLYGPSLADLARAIEKRMWKAYFKKESNAE